MVQVVLPVIGDTPPKKIIPTMSNPDEFIFYKGIVPVWPMGGKGPATNYFIHFKFNQDERIHVDLPARRR